MEVCSFGTLCHMSMTFKTTKFKKCSYPFDWIFSSLETIGHCIEDDFKIFLDKSYYKDISRCECGHTFYNNKLKMDDVNMFNHRNPLKNENDYQYYIRCINRFRLLLQSDKQKLFSMIFIRNTDTISNIKSLNEILKKHTTNFTLLIIFHSASGKRNHTFTTDDNIDFLDLHTISSSNGVQFENNEDNEYLDSIILERYNLFI